MERQLFINELKQMKLVAHRLGYQMTQYPENSLEVLKAIFENEELLNSCYGFEFDICFTKDHIPIVIHDKYVDDISDSFGLVQAYTLEELRKLNFKSRRSLKSDGEPILYKIITLEELLEFFQSNLLLLGDRIIKVETKDYIYVNKGNFSIKNMEVLANIMNRFPDLSNNLVHLSFWPLNLLVLKRIQKKKGYPLIKNDLLCDWSIMAYLTKFMSYLDNVSLRIKPSHLVKTDNVNSRRVNRKIRLDYFCMTFTNAIKEKNLKYAINKYGSVGLYTLNDYEEVDEVCRHISDEFFAENASKIVVTTNNPVYLKKMQ